MAGTHLLLALTLPQIFDLEWEHIWKKYWLFAGTTAEIPKAGDYFTYKVNKDSITSWQAIRFAPPLCRKEP